MLAPRVPAKGGPDYENRLRRYRRDQEERRRHPENWGFVPGPNRAGAQAAERAPRGQQR